MGKRERVVREALDRLEYATGQPKVDLSLTGEIYGRLHLKTRELSLDPHDTTAKELYQALMNLVKLHDKFLAKRLGLDPDNCDQEHLVRIVNRLKLNRQVWVLKPIVARRILKTLPPKQLLKLLHYRSIDSLIKREPPAALLAAAKRLESAHWQEQLKHIYKKLTPVDFEVRDITVRYLSPKRWGAVGKLIAEKFHTNVLSSVELGEVQVMELPKNETPGVTLLMMLLILHAMNDIRQHSTLFKFRQVEPEFGQLLINTLFGSESNSVRLVGQDIKWHVVHRYYGSRGCIDHPEIFEPHVQPEDLAYRKAEAVLYQLEPALHFWYDLDYVGLPSPDGPVSFNLMDNAINLVNRLPFGKRVNYHLPLALESELHGRYLAQRNLEQQLLLKLDERVLAQPTIFAELELIL